MRPKIMLLVFISTVFFLSCKKEETNEPVSVSCDFPDRLSKIVQYHYPDNQPVDSSEYLMVYDANGYLNKRQFKGSNSANYDDYDYFEFEAQGNCTKHEWKTFTGAPSRYYEYDYVDNQRSVTRFFSSISPGAPIMLQQTTYFFYTGSLLQKFENHQPQFGNPPSVATLSYSNDDKEVQIDYQESGGNLKTTIYYYSDLKNPVAIPELQFGYPENTWLLDSIVDTNNPASNASFQYQVDTAGRVISKTAYVYTLATYAVIERYYYNCQQ